MRVKGRVLLVDESLIILARGDALFQSIDNGESWFLFHKANVSFFAKLLMKIHFISRLLRLGFHHVISDRQNGFYVFVNKKLYRINSSGLLHGAIVEVIGSRPLTVCSFNGMVYYGQYCSNERRTSISVFCYDGLRHHVFSNIVGVRHVHGVFYDSAFGDIWMTTGDYGDEAAIWKFEDGAPKPVLQGGQQNRAVQLVITDDYIFFSTDTPIDKNYIKRYCRKNREVEVLQQVSSSVFYGCKVKNWLFFSTVAEPSELNTEKHIELWASNNGHNWQLISRFKKDILPMKLFQYGQLIFPSYECDSPYIWYYKMSVKGSGYSYRIKLSDL